MRSASVGTPIASAVLALATAVINLGLLFGWYTWTQAQTAGVNVVVVSTLGVVSAMRAQSQRAGRLVDTTKPS